MFSKLSALWWSEILSRTCWHFIFYQRRVFCKFLLNVSSVSLGQHQSCSSALWPLDSLSTKFCCQFSLRSASFPYFLYPDGPRLIRDTVADHTQCNVISQLKRQASRQKLFSSFAVQEYLIRLFLQIHGLFGLFTSPASSHHLAMADVLPVHFLQVFFVNKCFRCLRIPWCVRVCDVLSASLIRRVSPEHKMVCSNPIKPRTGNILPEEASHPWPSRRVILSTGHWCVLPRSAVQAFTVRWDGVIKDDWSLRSAGSGSAARRPRLHGHVWESWSILCNLEQREVDTEMWAASRK